jgi:hypothetical protein
MSEFKNVYDAVRKQKNVVVWRLNILDEREKEASTRTPSNEGIYDVLEEQKDFLLMLMNMMDKSDAS